MRFGLKSLLIVISVIAFALATYCGYRNYYKTTASGTTATVANRVMWSAFKLPISATDVTFFVDFGGCEAEFAIPEDDFLLWCSKRGWKVTEIKSPVPYFQPVCLASDDRLVSEGYTFALPDGEGVYDASRSRAAFYISTFP
jgi:hypothetical protein